MDYRLSRHAREKMALRGLSVPQVDAVLQSPGQIVAETGGRKCFQSKYLSGGTEFLLRVIVADAVTPAVVVTVYSTTQVDKYWV